MLGFRMDRVSVIAMAKRRTPRTAPRAVALDHGPALRIARGDVAIADRPDPDAPNRTVHGARVIYHAVWAAGRLGDDHHEAADRFLVALEAAQGASEARAGHSGVRLAPWQQGHPSARQIQAAADLRVAKAALGPVGWTELLQAIGANAWPAAWGDEPEDWHAAPQHVLEPLRVSLEVLVEVWRINS